MNKTFEKSGKELIHDLRRGIFTKQAESMEGPNNEKYENKKGQNVDHLNVPTWHINRSMDFL